jgi:hypothetical protein
VAVRDHPASCTIMQRALVVTVLALCLAGSARARTWEANLNGENQVRTVVCTKTSDAHVWFNLGHIYIYCFPHSVHPAENEGTGCK